MATELKTGVGRVVWGVPGKMTPKKNKDTRQTVLKDGQPVMQNAFGVAFPKDEFQATIWPAMAAEAATGYPNGIPPRFAWKYQDGDGTDSKGQPFNTRPGYAGCYILTVSTEADAPPVFKLVNGAYVQMTADQIKTGDYIACGLSLVVNVATGTNTPSLYVNPLAIEHVGYGQEIQSVGAVDPMALFGGQQRALPPGASIQPVAPVAGATMPGMTPQAPVMGGMQVMTAPPSMMAPQPGMMPAPMLPPGMMAPPPVMAPPPPPPVAPVGPTRPTDPSWIAPNPAGGEFWFNGTAWMPAPMLPPPAHDFVANAGMPGQMPPR